MNDLILEDTLDVFQIENRGTVVIGRIGPGWVLAKRGDEILLQTPDGVRFKTRIKDMEVRNTCQDQSNRGVLLADKFLSDQLPRGTKMLRIVDDSIA